MERVSRPKAEDRIMASCLRQISKALRAALKVTVPPEPGSSVPTGRGSIFVRNRFPAINCRAISHPVPPGRKARGRGPDLWPCDCSTAVRAQPCPVRKGRKSP